MFVYLCRQIWFHIWADYFGLFTPWLKSSESIIYFYGIKSALVYDTLVLVNEEIGEQRYICKRQLTRHGKKSLEITT